VTEKQHSKMVKIIKKCEREADNMMKMMNPRAHHQESHVRKCKSILEV